jgi:hypothetical protein
VRLAFRDEPDAARYVLPGRYAAEIVVRRARADGTQEFVALGVTSTIDLPRGILTRLTFDGK